MHAGAKVSRIFRTGRPKRLRVSDVACAPTWSGAVRAAIAIDALPHRIVACRVPASTTARLAPEAPNGALRPRRSVESRGWIHPSDRGSPHLSIRCTERLVDADVGAPVW